MRASRRQRGGGSVEDSSDFLETQQVTIEGEELLQIFHIEDNVPKIKRPSCPHLVRDLKV